MTKYELVAHMANMIRVMDFHDKLGTTKNPMITAEFHRCHQELVTELEKEQKDEARKSADEVRAHENGASFKSGFAGSRLPDRM